MAQWITRLPTEQKIPGSTPGWLVNRLDPMLGQSPLRPSGEVRRPAELWTACRRATLHLNIGVEHTAKGGPVAQWITRLPTEQKIPGSTPGWLANRLDPMLGQSPLSPSGEVRRTAELWAACWRVTLHLNIGVERAATGGPVAQRITCLPTEQKIPVSTPGSFANRLKPTNPFEQVF